MSGVPEQSRRFGHVCISGITVGKIVDYGLKDSQNMGACMAPAAMDTIMRNFGDMGVQRHIMTASLQATWDISAVRS